MPLSREERPVLPADGADDYALQVTLVPNYIMLDKLGLLDTYYALVLPMIFVPLGTFIMTQSFQAVPNEIIEAARLDGCGTLKLICRIAVPMNRAGLICTLLLSFLDGWNMVEQPMVYLEDFGRYPISVALASVPPENPTVQLVCCILVALPPLFLFAYFNRELVEGIALGGENEKQALCFGSLILYILIACTIVSAWIEATMMTQVEQGPVNTKAAHEAVTRELPPRSLFADQEGLHLYEIYDGTGWESGKRIREVSGWSLTSECVSVSGFPDTPYVFSATRQPRAGEKVLPWNPRSGETTLTC